MSTTLKTVASSLAHSEFNTLGQQVAAHIRDIAGQMNGAEDAANAKATELFGVSIPVSADLSKIVGGLSEAGEDPSKKQGLTDPTNTGTSGHDLGKRGADLDAKASEDPTQRPKPGETSDEHPGQTVTGGGTGGGSTGGPGSGSGSAGSDRHDDGHTELGGMLSSKPGDTFGGPIEAVLGKVSKDITDAPATTVRGEAARNAFEDEDKSAGRAKTTTSKDGTVTTTKYSDGSVVVENATNHTKTRKNADGSIDTYTTDDKGHTHVEHTDAPSTSIPRDGDGAGRPHTPEAFNAWMDRKNKDHGGYDPSKNDTDANPDAADASGLVQTGGAVHSFTEKTGGLKDNFDHGDFSGHVTTGQLPNNGNLPGKGGVPANRSYDLDAPSTGVDTSKPNTGHGGEIKTQLPKDSGSHGGAATSDSHDGKDHQGDDFWSLAHNAVVVKQLGSIPAVVEHAAEAIKAVVAKGSDTLAGNGSGHDGYDTAHSDTGSTGGHADGGFHAPVHDFGIHTQQQELANELHHATALFHH